jgi:hypothetical protein
MINHLHLFRTCCFVCVNLLFLDYIYIYLMGRIDADYLGTTPQISLRCLPEIIYKKWRIAA